MALTTERFRLVPATAALIRADLQGASALAAALGSEVPGSWPPDLYDAPAMEHMLGALQKDPANQGWTLFYMVTGENQAAGIVGYKGKPTADGTVEVGYSILADQRKRGLATEATAALVARAFQTAEVTRVIAETMPALLPSIRVLEKNGFRLIGEGSEPGVIRFELTREDYVAGHREVPSHLRHLLRLLGHLAWADTRAMDALERGLPPDPDGVSLLAHILGAEHVWLARLTGVPPRVAVWPQFDLTGCKRLATENERGLREFIFQLHPADLRRGVVYRNSAGQEYVTAVEDILLHLFLHGTYHRGQVAQRLRLGGQTPEPTDYIAFARGAAAATRPP